MTLAIRFPGAAIALGLILLLVAPSRLIAVGGRWPTPG